MKITLGSTSVHKLAAVSEASNRLDLSLQINGLKTGSGINEQPVGFNETFNGAFKRAESVREQDPETIALGIESGIFRFSEKVNCTLDIAAIVLILPNNRKIITTSSGVRFPEECVKEAESRGFRTTTVGSVLTEYFGGDPTDPHSVITDNRVSRTMTLVDALCVAFRQI